MRKITDLFMTLVLTAIILFIAQPVFAQEKSPAESQVDKATEYWDKMKGFTEDEPGTNKGDDKSNDKIIKQSLPPAPTENVVTEPPSQDKKPTVTNIQPRQDRDNTLEEGINDIAEQIIANLPTGSATTVAVIDFNDLQGKVTMLGRYVGEELITRLFQAKRVKVIERSLLEKALDELKFNTTDLVDPNAAQQLGKVVGAEALVTGTLTDLGRLIKVNARVIKVETGEVIGAASTQIIKTMSVEDMMKNVLVYSKSRQSLESEKGNISGKIFEFKDQVVEVELFGKPAFKVVLVSIEFIDKNRPKVNMMIENLLNGTSSYAVRDPKRTAYVLDETGEVYPFQEVMQLPIFGSFKEIVPHAPLKFSVTFSEIPITSKKITVVVRIQNAYNVTRDITFRNLVL